MPKQNKILAASVATSLLLHIGFFLFLQTHSFGFHSSEIASSKTRIFSLEKIRRDQILKESFTPITKEPVAQKYLPESEAATSPIAHFPIHYTAIEHTLTTSLVFEDLLSSNAFPVRSFSLPKLQNLDLFATLPKDLIVPFREKRIHSTAFFPNTESVLPVSPETTINPIEPEQTLLSFSPVVATFHFEESSRATPAIPIPALPEMPSLADLDTVNLSHSFDAELTFCPRKDGPGYLFALTLIPRPDLEIPTIRQHLVFLIDRSNSIQQDRLQATKAAVFQSIEELAEEDTFNIIAFDSKMEKLAPSFMKVNPQTLAKTGEFLNKIQLGSFFSLGDLYRPLFITIPSHVQEDEMYTAILLTDGESLSKKQMQEALTRDWTLQNCGRVSLYALAMETDPQLATLDVACHFNQGRLIYTNSYRGLKRKLLKLMKGIKHPIAKNITLKAISKSPNTNIEIHPTPSPAIYLDQPYVLLGSTDTTDDFILFIQGQLKDQWLNIKKTISFVNAKKGGNSLKSEWALQQAYQQYEKYVFEGDQKYLTEAHSLLEPFNLQTAFR